MLCLLISAPVSLVPVIAVVCRGGTDSYNIRMNSLREELAIVVRAKEVVTDLGEHLFCCEGYRFQSVVKALASKGQRKSANRKGKEDKHGEHTRSSSNLSLSSSVLSRVMRLFPLMSTTPPALKSSAQVSLMLVTIMAMTLNKKPLLIIFNYWRWILLWRTFH